MDILFMHIIDEYLSLSLSPSAEVMFPVEFFWVYNKTISQDLTLCFLPEGVVGDIKQAG